MATSAPRQREHFRISGARALLKPFHRKLPVERDLWEPIVAPMVRGMDYAAAGGGRNLWEVAAELRLTADLFTDALTKGTPLPKRIPQASPLDMTPVTLREIADHVEECTSKPRGDVMVTTSELSLRFPRLIPLLSVYFGQDGTAISDDMSGSTIEEGLQMWIDHVHPQCPWELPGVAAECYEALAVFHDEDTVDRFFAQEHGGGSGSRISWSSSRCWRRRASTI